MPYLAPVGGGGPRRGGGHRVALAFDRRPSKAPAMRAKHNPGSGRLTCVFKVCLDGKGENKKPAPARRGESKRPYWHTGGAALGLAGSNKMLSVPPHRRDQDGSAEGGATRLGTIGYRAKANACPGLAAWT